MTFEEQGDRLVVRHKARTGFMNYMGLIAIFLLPCSVMMFAVNALSPINVAIGCDRAQNLCTCTPVSAGWDSTTFTLEQIPLVHVEGSGAGRIIYLGNKNASMTEVRRQLSNGATSNSVGDQYTKAVEDLQAWAKGTEPLFKITYPAGDQGAPWPMALMTFLFGAFWTWQMFRAPRSTELIVDRARRELQIDRKFLRGKQSQKLSFDDIGQVVKQGTKNRMALAIVSVETKSAGSVIIFDEGAFPASIKDADLLLEKLKAFGLPVSVQS